MRESEDVRQTSGGGKLENKHRDVHRIAGKRYMSGPRMIGMAHVTGDKGKNPNIIQFPPVSPEVRTLFFHGTNDMSGVTASENAASNLIVFSTSVREMVSTGVCMYRRGMDTTPAATPARLM